MICSLVARQFQRPLPPLRSRYIFQASKALDSRLPFAGSIFLQCNMERSGSVEAVFGLLLHAINLCIYRVVLKFFIRARYLTLIGLKSNEMEMTRCCLYSCQVSLWDAIILAKERTKLWIHTSNKYRFIDQGGNSLGIDYNLALH
ncbi:hypothetical protein HPP92_010292 [Vanilla planifolia]|uniref:Uncharacterized protein n=1 Tax=Vanilla planifolia TaxID=51239 RepID=A0A835R9A7_VANPL|nr:hypothetical protein HPP92_010292 [Vanilla planifolia]